MKRFGVRWGSKDFWIYSEILTLIGFEGLILSGEAKIPGFVPKY